MRSKDRRRGKIKDCGNNRVCECECRGEGGGAGGKQIESVSAPLYSRWGFHSSRSLFTILPLRLSKEQLFSGIVTAPVEADRYPNRSDDTS